MKNQDYKTTKKKSEELLERLRVYDCLIACGIPQKMVHYYEHPSVGSGYSMGEKVIVRVGYKPIEIIDNRKEYAKTCRYSARHGMVVLNFTKAALKKYVSLCKTFTDGSIDDKVAASTEIRGLVRKQYDEKASVVRKFEVY